MTKPHITNPRDRATKKYRAIHAQLRAEVYASRKPKRRKPKPAIEAGSLFL